MKKLVSTAVVTTVFILCSAAPSHAAVITSTIASYDGTVDFSGNYPLAPVNIGAFTFTIPADFTVAGATVSGTFGDEDVPGATDTTADVDLYVDGVSINVASCDSPNVASTGTLTLACDGGNNNDTPTSWSYTFTAADLLTLAPAFASGTLDLNAVQNYYGAVNLGVTTLTISPTPEPAAFTLLPLGLAGLALLRRRRS